MQLKINGEKLDITLENEKTVGDVLAAFETEAEKNGMATIGIALNGETVPADRFDSILGTPLEETTVIDLSVISAEGIKAEFKKLASSLDAARAPLSELSVLLQGGKDAEAAAVLASLATEMDTFCHVARLSTAIPGLYTSVTIETRPLNDFLGDLLPVLKDLEEALQSHDAVTVGDLAEYELTPRLEQLTAALHQLA